MRLMKNYGDFMEQIKKMMVLILLMVIAISGCTDNASIESKLSKTAGVEDVTVGSTFHFEQKFTEQNQQRLIRATPPPKLDTSLERENLIRRYEFLNDQNKIFYVYLIDYGKVMGYYTAKGKISSVNSRLTQEEQIVYSRGGYTGSSLAGTIEGFRVVGSPQLDGSYGTNGDGIFFFTTEGAYVEWNGKYIVSDFPLQMATPPILIQKVD